MTRIAIDEAEYGVDQRWRLDGHLFSGEIVEADSAGDLLELVTVRNGIPEGPTLAWFPGGRLREQTWLRQGIPYGTTRIWHPNGQLEREIEFDSRGLVAAERQWDAEGRPVGGAEDGTSSAAGR